MVNKADLENLEEHLTELITKEKERAEEKESALLKKISTLETDNINLRQKLDNNKVTILETIQSWIGSLTESIRVTNKELGALANRVESEEKKLGQEREDFGSQEGVISGINGRIESLNNEIALVKLEVQGRNDPTEKQWTGTRWEKSNNTNPNGNNGNGDLINTLTSRMDHLEDQCRRDNLIFYGIGESQENETWDDCENAIKNIIRDKELFQKDQVDDIEIVRAHRLGQRDNDPNKPRPIIVKFAKFKTKASIIGNAVKLDGGTVKLSEDFCVNTNKIRKELLSAGKNLSNRTNVTIKKYHVNYKTLTVSTDINNNNIIFSITAITIYL